MRICVQVCVHTCDAYVHTHVQVSRQLLQLKEAIQRKAYASGLSKCTGLRVTMEAFERAAALVVTWQSRPEAMPLSSASARLGKLLLEKDIKVGLYHGLY